jgi:hypothetical protein
MAARLLPGSSLARSPANHASTRKAGPIVMPASSVLPGGLEFVIAASRQHRRRTAACRRRARIHARRRPETKSPIGESHPGQPIFDGSGQDSFFYRLANRLHVPYANRQPAAVFFRPGEHSTARSGGDRGTCAPALPAEPKFALSLSTVWWTSRCAMTSELGPGHSSRSGVDARFNSRTPTSGLGVPASGVGSDVDRTSIF